MTEDTKQKIRVQAYIIVFTNFVVAILAVPIALGVLRLTGGKPIADGLSIVVIYAVWLVSQMVLSTVVSRLIMRHRRDRVTTIVPREETIPLHRTRGRTHNLRRRE